MKKYFIIFFLFAREGWCQQPAHVRDTSFTIRATLLKESKKYPFIKIAAPEKSRTVIQKNDIVYRTIRERKLLLDVFHPSKKKKNGRPAILLVFGGGWRSGDKSHNHAIATALANKGYIAVSPEYRLSTEALFPAALHDLKSAVRWMKVHADEFGIDTSNIAALGCSAGGQLAALMGVTNNNLAFEESQSTEFSSSIKAVINIDGILAFKHPESAEAASASTWLGGSYEQKPAIWEEASALTHVSNKTVPFLFINSSIPRFHAGRNDMIAKMNTWGIYSEVHTFPDTPHPFWFFHPWFDPMMKYIFDFLKKQFGR